MERMVSLQDQFSMIHIFYFDVLTNIMKVNNIHEWCFASWKAPLRTVMLY